MNEFYFAQKAFILHNNSLLVIQKSHFDAYHPGKWEVPGGRMEFGEEVDTHIKREVFEEVGIDIIPGHPFYLWQWHITKKKSDSSAYQMQIVAVARRCETSTPELVTTSHQVESDTISEARWVPLDELLTLDWIPNMMPVVQAFLKIP